MASSFVGFRFETRQRVQLEVRAESPKIQNGGSINVLASRSRRTELILDWG